MHIWHSHLIFQYKTQGTLQQIAWGGCLFPSTGFFEQNPSFRSSLRYCNTVPVHRYDCRIFWGLSFILLSPSSSFPQRATTKYLPSIRAGKQYLSPVLTQKVIAVLLLVFSHGSSNQSFTLCLVIHTPPSLCQQRKKLTWSQEKWNVLCSLPKLSKALKKNKCVPKTSWIFCFYIPG